MTFDEFKQDFLAFLENSTVNLGRKKTKTRQMFLYDAIAKFVSFESNSEQMSDTVEKRTEVPKPMSGSVIRIKPKDKKMSLDIGKGVHAMTSSESARADEQLNRSPFVNKNKKEGEKNG